MIDIVLKWSPRLRSDTIQRHIEVASKRGSVWWGRRASSHTVGLAAEWLEELRSQLAAGRQTYVFLHSKPGGTWRAVLLGINSDSSAVDARLIPSYYDAADQYSLWVNLTRLQRFDPLRLTEQYVLARTGAPLTTKGLNNQTPLILRRRDAVSLASGSTRPGRAS
jgi:hypothetical protein